MPKQRLDLRGEKEQAVHRGEVQRVNTKRVARQQEPAPPNVIEGEGKLAVQPAQKLLPVLLVEMEDDLHVAARAEDVPLPRKLAPQVGLVEDLAVADQRQRAGLVVERLGAARAGGAR